MNLLERHIIFALSSILSLRMLGLFMVLPVFTLYAQHLTGATPTSIGLAMGVYGLTQAALQIPFGALSDHIGRKKIIIIGLIFFILGSLLSATAHSISMMLIGRALQGAGAIGSTVIAMMADLTEETSRTKAMAIAGITIGASFGLAMILGPLFSPWIHVNGLFWLAALFGLLAIFILLKIPTPQHISWHEESEPELHSFPAILKNPNLMQLNIGIFILHLIFTATFVVLPLSLEKLIHQQWLLYLPILLLAFLLSYACISVAERRAQIKHFFVGAIFILGVAELFLWIYAKNLLISAASLLLFFTAFSLLEAFLPSLISRAAPAHRKGTALGIYSCAQFLGIFIGGALGGWLYGRFGLTEVFLCCVLLTIIWLIIAVNMQKNYLGGHHGKRYQ